MGGVHDILCLATPTLGLKMHIEANESQADVVSWGWPRRPDARAAVAAAVCRHLDDRRARAPRHPVPEAAHKVGESPVEIGAHYFDTRARPQGAPDAAPAAEVRLPLLLLRRPRATSTR